VINNNPRSTINQQRLPIVEPVQQQQQQQNPAPQQQNTNRVDDGIPRIGNPNQCRICGLVNQLFFIFVVFISINYAFFTLTK